MDVALEQRINAVIEHLNRISSEQIDYQLLDPVAKMMLVALIHECQKIHDCVDGIPDKIIDKYCSDFIPRDKIAATPAIAVVELRFKAQRIMSTLQLRNGMAFSYKPAGEKIPLNYIPIFQTLAIPYNGIYILTPGKLYTSTTIYDIAIDKRNCLWIGINTNAEIDCMKNFSLLVKGTHGIAPLSVTLENSGQKLNFTDMSRFDEIDMAEPFDAQQSSETMFSMIEAWKDKLLGIDNGTLVCITDDTVDRDIFKPRAYPKIFQNWLESETLDCFTDGTIWLRLEFPEGYTVPDDCSAVLNVLPVVNVDVNTLTLTQSTPIAKLQKQGNSYFLQVLETSNSDHKQGFNMSADEIIIRDFDASCYNNGDIYREVRSLYNHFIDDYHAFMEYHGIKDGELIRVLRETINKIAKNIGNQNAKYKFDSGTYAMKNMNQFPLSTSTKVAYLTTAGEIGNSPREGETMENKKLPSIDKDLPVIVSATGGRNKAGIDERYEMLRYYSLTLDRLYTKKDIEAFLRKEIISTFGKDEFPRIFIRMNISGAKGEKRLQRGLYIDIDFKDKKNYERAIATGFDKRVHQGIIAHSCISMPIILNMNNLELTNI